MTDSPVIGSASFELRAETDRLMRETREAERELKRQVERIEKEYFRGGKNAADAFGRSQREMVRDAQKAERDIRKSSEGISRSLKASAAAFAGTVSVGTILSLSDGYTRFANQLRVAGVEGAAFAQVQDALAATAIKNGVSLEGLATLYGRAAQSAGELGASESDLIRFTEGVSAALRIQGGDAASAQGALLQLSQALAAGTVRAEEFNSVNEGARPILEAVANGSQRFGGSVARLREAVLAGTVTSKEFFGAFLAGASDLEAKAAKAPLTVAQGFTNLQSALTLYVGQSDLSKGATAAMSGALQLLADNLDLIIPSLAAITAGVGTAYVAGAVAATGATGFLTAALGGLRVAMTAISTHPIVAALTIIAAGLAFVATSGGEAERAASDLADELDRQARAANTAAEQQRGLAGELTQTQTWAAGLTGEVDKLADAHYRAAAAAKAQAIEEARLRVVQGRETLAQARQAYDQRYSRERQRFGVDPSNGRFAGIEGPGADVATRTAQAVVRTPEYQNLLGATGNLNRFTADLNRLLGAPLASFQPPARPPAAPPSTTSRARGDASAAAVDTQALREALELQNLLEIARASGNEAAIRSIERRQDLIRLTAEFERAGYEDAAARAEDHLNELDEVRNRREQIAEWERKSLEFWEELGEQAREQSALMLERLRFEADLAQLEGDPNRIKQRERELFIESRINELLADRRRGLTPEQARAQAQGEWDARDEADRVGRMRDEFRRSFTDGIRAAIDGDLGSFFDRLADRFTDRMLDNLADDLFNLVRSTTGGSGGGWLSTIGSFIGSAFGGTAFARATTNEAGPAERIYPA